MFDAACSVLDRVLAGTANPEDIDDAIDRWHDGDRPMELHSFLGMTPKQYAAWVKQPEALADILHHRWVHMARARHQVFASSRSAFRKKRHFRTDMARSAPRAMPPPFARHAEALQGRISGLRV